jgi:hypothetical protein
MQDPEQATPHAPQFCAVLVGPQLLSAAPASGVTHAPFWHTVPAAHVVTIVQIPVDSHVCTVDPAHCSELGTQEPEQVPALQT